MDRLKERLASARLALGSLEELVALPQPTKVERDAAIQRFEYTCEATWKAIQLGLREEEGIEVASPKGIARAAHQVGLLDDAATRLALAMVDDRNKTVHTYNEAVAQAIHSRLAGHARLLRVWIEASARWIE
jgi:nucleotidyltransferase substrate binding protein (TIGR01987 family)